MNLELPRKINPTRELVRRLIAAESTCLTDWLRAMQELPGNPLGVAIGSFGQTTALACARIPAEVFNRVFGLTVEDRALIPAIVAFYQEHGATPVFDLDPYAIPPFWIKPNVYSTLVGLGLCQGAFHQILYAEPTLTVPAPAAHLSIEEVTATNADEFVRVYEQVWGDGKAIRVLINRPAFRCYLAQVEGEAAALGILHVANGVGSMANALTIPAYRNRGCHTALLYHRIRVAAEAGCDLLVSQCTPGTTSQQNQLRVGFQLAGTKAWWIPTTRL